MSETMIDKIVDAALVAVERDKGIRKLSLRAIARDAGCSHVNLYHYVDSMDSLLWKVYARSLHLFKSYCDDSIDSRLPGKSLLHAHAAGMIGFARKHEGLYRVLWFEDLRIAAPPDVMELAIRVSREYEALAMRALANDGAAGDLRVKADFLFSFIHGRIAFLLNRRIFGSGDEEERAVLDSVDALLEMLAEKR